MADFTVMSYNVRFDTKRDVHDPWEGRKKDVCSLIAQEEPLVFALQEPLLHQVQHVHAGVNEELASPRYQWYGVGRHADGSGELCPVFYDTTRVTALESGTFWLAHEWNVCGAKHPDAAHPRICSWVKLQGEGFGTFVVFNTHFDHRGAQARAFSASLILERIPHIAGLFPSVVCGDFNSKPDDIAMKTMRSTFLTDCYDAASHKPEGRNTFTGFDGTTILVIDYLLVSGFEVADYRELHQDREGSARRPSDHCPIVATLTPKYA